MITSEPRMIRLSDGNFIYAQLEYILLREKTFNSPAEYEMKIIPVLLPIGKVTPSNPNGLAYLATFPK